MTDRAVSYPPGPIAATVAALAHTPAGPALSALLAELELPSLTGSQCVDVLRARYRQDSHERGQLLSTIAELMHRTDPDSAAFEEFVRLVIETWREGRRGLVRVERR